MNFLSKNEIGYYNIIDSPEKTQLNNGKNSEKNGLDLPAE